VSVPRRQVPTRPKPSAARPSAAAALVGYEIAEPHGHECRQYIGHRRAVGRDRAVVPFRIADPGVQRTADEHLPFAEQQRRAEAGEGEPQMGEDQSLAIPHSSASVDPPADSFDTNAAAFLSYRTFHKEHHERDPKRQHSEHPKAVEVGKRRCLLLPQAFEFLPS
jgi:hypothetical protein